MMNMLPKDQIYTVSQVAGLVHSALQREPALAQLWVRGEITNYKRHGSGHLYFSLKDTDTVIRAVMFKGHASKLNFEPVNGQDCFFRGYVGLYPRETQLQFYVEAILPAGIGEEALALEALKKLLQAKGYFAAENKKTIPHLPQAIGVVSSATGAVIRDIQKVLWRRYPGMPIFLYPAAVQGKEAVDSLVLGLRAMEEAPVDVVIVARGGGSAEDLSAFNTEAVATAIFECSKPVISAVGHETDVTIADLVADLRAATPSMAAELAVPIKDELLRALTDREERLRSSLLRQLDRSEERLQRAIGSVALDQPLRWLDPKRERLQRAEEKLLQQIERIIQDKHGILQKEAARLNALSPLATLGRGYTVCRNAAGQVILQSDQVAIGEFLDLNLAKGRLKCQVAERSVD